MLQSYVKAEEGGPGTTKEVFPAVVPTAPVVLPVRAFTAKGVFPAAVRAAFTT